MAKYSYEFKKKIVDAYFSGAGGYQYLANYYGVPTRNNIKKWALAYQKLGDEGLLRSRQQKKYYFEYKLHVVELYQSSEVSYQELALQEGINNPVMLTKWVNDFRSVGSDALRPKKKGRKKSLGSINDKKDKTPEEVISTETSAEYVKQLEDELLKLRTENAYLKELRRLHLEEEALLKKQ